MANQTDPTAGLLAYVREVSLRDDDILRGLREETARLPGGAALQVMAEEGQLLGLLVRLTGARAVLEIGTFTGYSTLCMARALPAGGTVVTCDITDRWPDIGLPYWKRAGVDGRIELRIGDAAGVLEGLLAERGPDSFDLVFIDADKAGYPVYYAKALTLTRPGGLVVIDNTLFFGRVTDPGAQDPDSRAIRGLNAALLHDERVDLSLLPMADGITLARKR
ncbi:O-methyltransferase [Streptomyces clavuligerus]|uniref:O-methyltransferase n=1 Tax=Streptomyces clavuligerus TaxID=1901 RepID=UPI0001800BC4|nr:class I SAM-dependent methyltransferase [Streptomyces clavuligerus]ANW21723.1 SAM-dependent methyltransferase [Streptomyces clavuligerus]AXU16356.1 SAM-dependent methyltransferase [Streptomyces clavuligerus]EDY53082.1 O-methyltransferase mdmC [Streptomyces clavuligerus]MBY6306518.1 class I SAM-dependent methyltransferase [Streptomyces clavuligerus]QCS09135.1 SAM-dependent methyltransferase [Streptomyces clavuligerus]